MDLYVWLNNGTSDVSTHIQGWSSLAWTEGYQEESTFEVRFARGSFTKNTLPMHTLLTLGDTRYVQVVLQRELKDGQLIVSGEGFDSWVLKRRFLGMGDGLFNIPTWTFTNSTTANKTYSAPYFGYGMDDYIGNPWRAERAAELALLTVSSYNRASSSKGPWCPSTKFAESLNNTTAPSDSLAGYNTTTFSIPNSTVTTDFTGSGDSVAEDRTWSPDATLYDEVGGLLIEAGGWVRFLRPSRTVLLPTTSGTFVGHEFSFGNRRSWSPPGTSDITYSYWPRQVARTTETFGGIYTMSQWNVFNGSSRRNVLYDAFRGDLTQELLTEKSRGLYTYVGYEVSDTPSTERGYYNTSLGDFHMRQISGSPTYSHLLGAVSSGKKHPVNKIPWGQINRIARKSRPKTEYGAIVNNSRFVYNVDYAIGDRVRVRTSFGEIEDALIGSTTRYETRNEGYSVSHKLIFD